MSINLTRSDEEPLTPAQAPASPEFDVFPEIDTATPAPVRKRPEEHQLPPLNPPSAPRRTSKNARWTIRVAPEADAETPPLDWTDPNFWKGLGASVGFHFLLLAVLWIGLLIWARAQPDPLEPVQLELGTTLGDDGLDPRGAFDERLDQPESQSTPLSPLVFDQTPTPDLQLTANLNKPENLLPPSEREGGGGADFGRARFGNGGETIRGVQVKVGDPQFTLLWDQPVDLDLHVIEPGGEAPSRLDDDEHHIFFAQRDGKLGGELDVDNTRGYGPENIYWLLEQPDDLAEKTLTRGPAGQYRWYVHYYGRDGGRPPLVTSWKVRVKHKEQTKVYEGKLARFGERSRIFTLDVTWD